MSKLFTVPRLLLSSLLLGGVLVLAGCEEEKGALEKAGEAADQAIQEAAEKADEAVEKAKEAVEEATKD